MTEVVEKVETESVNLTDKIKASANQIWLAGLGAYAKAEAEGVKVVQSLIEEGEEVESRMEKIKDDATASSGALKDKASKSIEELKATVNSYIEKVEAVLEQGTSSVISFLGLPSKGDIDALTKKIDSLNRSVKALK